MSEQNRFVGRVIKFYPEKGYGFIRNKRDQTSYFVHISQIIGQDNLNAGDVVEFSVGFNKRANKEQAINVLVVENR